MSRPASILLLLLVLSWNASCVQRGAQGESYESGPPPGPTDPLDLPAPDAAQALADRLLDRGLEDRGAYQLLVGLLARAPKRLSGSPGYADAATWAELNMRAIGLEEVHREPVLVPHWVRGDAEEVTLLRADGSRKGLAACALGGSVATPAEGLEAPVVAVHGLKDLAARAKAGEDFHGKVVFLDRPMPPTARSTFHAYGRTVGQRTRGAVEAARLGAVGLLIRSVSTGDDDVPHTGTMHYEDGVPRIPALALGVHSAEALDAELAAGRVEGIRMHCSCRTLPDVEQWNVVGEIPGLDHPEEILVVGGHLDAWETGDGAQDDGAGCCQALEAARLLLVCGVRPSRTIRVVLYANEENGSRGGREYARLHAQERHVLAMESDSGGFAPRGIALGFPQDVLSRLRPYGEPLAAVGAERVLGGGGGSDVAPLKGLGAILGSLRVDDARYFDLHHSANDTLAAVNSRELELGAITMAYWLALLGNSGLAM